ncbi:MAG: alpha/beta fold hydrolase [Deltaproteobacteria bacterium]|nr:MAG: alpha/beta fold hydrolase [Deltaproteobacteria bacterium]TNF25753.1 MAG: alpha/beta fold hydrolase [Deltaproteobacteria bacterium]
MKNLVILIPGNPSVPGIYDPFIQQVVQELKVEGEKKWEILPHLGQCNTRRVRYKKVTLHDVIDDHKRKINELIVKHKADKVFLMGHSLGSAVTITLFEEFNTKIDHFVILCPFVGPSKKNIPFLHLFKNPVSRMGMKNLSHAILLNDKISQHFFETWLGTNPHNEHIAKEIKKPYYIDHFFKLVSSYFDSFEALNVRERMKEIDGKKTLFVFAPDDFWVPQETLDLLPNHSTYHVCESISHDFCLSEAQYKEVARVIGRHF